MQRIKLSYRIDSIARIGLGSGLALLSIVGLTMLACPITVMESYAAEDSGVTTNANIAIAITSLADLELQPDVNDGFSYSMSELTVSTTSLDGFKVMLSSTSENLQSVNVSDMENLIQNLTKASIPSEFSENSWGYYIGETTPNDDSLYQPIPTEDTAILELNESTERQDYKLAFGAKVDPSLPAGIYDTTILVSVVANPVKMGALSQITYMQEMTSEICQNTADYIDKDHYATKQLIDTRDGKSYWVAKLADGNCWMVQNLALDLNNTTLPLKSATSNVQTDTNLSTTYTSFTPVSASAISDTDTFSWDFGQWVNATPNSPINCGKNVRHIAQCAESNHYIDVSDETKWSPTYKASKGTWGDNTIEQTIAVRYTDPANHGLGGEYDPHYLVGNYYQFNTATAGVGGASSVVNFHTQTSVCPSHWTLPYGDLTGNATGTGLFFAPLFAYGISRYPGATTANGSAAAANGQYLENSQGYNLFQEPLYFARNGRVYYTYTAPSYDAGIMGIGIEGLYWTATANKTGGAYSFIYSGSSVSATTATRWFGNNIRCVAL